jgi:hypothetical protein
MPEQDAVLAITSGVKDMQAVLNLVWDKLLPAMGPGSIAADAAAHEKLKGRLAGLVLPVQKGDSSSEIASKVAGTRYSFSANDQKLEMLGLDRGEASGEMALIARVSGVDVRMPCGNGAWRKGRMAFGSLAEQPAAGCGAWTAADTYTAKICFSETPFTLTVTLKFADDQLLVDSESNVGFNATKRPQLTGTAGASR